MKAGETISLLGDFLLIVAASLSVHNGEPALAVFEVLLLWWRHQP